MTKEKIIKITKSIMVLIMFNYIYLFQYIPLILFKINTKTLRHDYQMQVLFSFFSGLCLTFILLLLYRKDLIEEFKKMKNNLGKNIDIGLACWTIGLIIMAVSNTFLFYVLNSGGANNENAVQAYIKIVPWIMGIDICLLAPFNEELVFRKTLKDIFKNPYIYFISSFLLFGTVHVIDMATSWIDWLYIIPYGALGAAFAVAYHKTDTVFTPMLLHMMHNTMLFLLSISIK